jgi:hypothetical protein
LATSQTTGGSGGGGGIADGVDTISGWKSGLPGTGESGRDAAGPVGLGAGVVAGRTGGATSGRGAGGGKVACAKAGAAAAASIVVATSQEVARVPFGTFNLFILNEYPKSLAILHLFLTARQSRRRNSRRSSSFGHARKPILKRGWLRSR